MVERASTGSPVKVIEDDLVQGNVIGNHDAVRVEIVHAFVLAALLLGNLHHGAHVIVGHDDGRLLAYPMVQREAGSHGIAVRRHVGKNNDMFCFLN